MKRLATVCCLVAAVACWLRPAGGAEIVLEAESNLTIVEEGPFGNARGRLSELLQKYLLLVLGKDKLAGPGEKVTFVIEAGAETWDAVARHEIKDPADVDAFQIDVLPEPAGSVRIRGATAIAAGFGVTFFLQEYLDVFWAMPGELGLCLPKQKTFRLPETHRRVAPAFVSRACTGFVFRDAFVKPKPPPVARSGLLYQQRAFFYGHDYFKNLRLHPLASPSHAMARLFPPELQNVQPEVFPIIDGRRWFPPPKTTPRGRAGGAWQAWHPCYSEPKTAERAIEKAKQAFAEGRYCFSLGVNDGRKVPCQCPRCRAAGFPESYYRFVTRVADAVKNFDPPRLVGLIAYGDVKEPPEDLALPDNVLVSVVGGGPGAIARWAPHAQVLGIYEHFPGQGFWIPNLPLAAMAHNARLFAQHGIRFYRAEAYPIWAFDAPRVYLQSRLLWDPGLDLDAELRRFCEAAFAEAAAPMYRFYEGWAALRDDVVPDGVTPMLGLPPDKLWLDPVRQFALCRPRDFQHAADCLAEAESLVEDGRAARRLEMVATFFEDSRTLFAMDRLSRQAFDRDARQGAETRIAELVKLRKKRDAILEKIKAHPEWFAGTSAGIGDDLVPSWEQRSAVSMMRMIRGAVIADVFRLNEQHAPAPPLPEEFRIYQEPFHVRTADLRFHRKHAWYGVPEKFVPLEVAPDGHGARFRSLEGAAPWSDHPSWAGARKVHWAAAVVRDAPAGDRNLHLVELEATGRGGRLVVRVHSAAAGSTCRDAMLFEAFGPAGATIHRRIAVPPPGPEAGTLRADRPRSETTGSIKIYLEWEPVDDEAPLEGSCRVRRVEFEPAGSGA